MRSCPLSQRLTMQAWNMVTDLAPTPANRQKDNGVVKQPVYTGRVVNLPCDKSALSFAFPQ